MKYNEVWEAVDKLAEMNGLTPSGLAKKAGLDPTVFNKSKRVRPDGKKRWPSLESINKITSACHISFEEFYHLLDKTGQTEGIRGQFMLPVYNISNLLFNADSSQALFYMNFPEVDADIYALLIDHKHSSPAYPTDSVLIISPQAKIKKGNKIILSLKHSSEFLLAEFINRTDTGIKVRRLSGADEKISVEHGDIDKIGRIMWVSQ